MGICRSQLNGGERNEPGGSTWVSFFFFPFKRMRLLKVHQDNSKDDDFYCLCYYTAGYKRARIIVVCSYQPVLKASSGVHALNPSTIAPSSVMTKKSWSNTVDTDTVNTEPQHYRRQPCVPEVKRNRTQVSPSFPSFLSLPVIVDSNHEPQMNNHLFITIVKTAPDVANKTHSVFSFKRSSTPTVMLIVLFWEPIFFFFYFVVLFCVLHLKGVERNWRVVWHNPIEPHE